MSLLSINSDCMPTLREPTEQSRYNRDIETDVKKAIDLAFKFKKEIDELHPFAGQLTQKLFTF